MTTFPTNRDRLVSRAWADEAVRRIEADANRSADTHLHAFPLPEDWGIDLYLKDESVHPTGSLKHRLARSLFLYGLCNGWIGERTTIVEASSGSTAVSEAYFARFLGLPFIAVMPASTSPEKIALIEAQGATCHLVDDPTTVYDVAQRLAAERGGYFLDQFTYAERATDWRGNNNIAESIFSQMAWSGIPSRPGSWSGPGPAGPARRSGATPASAGSPPGCAWSTREDSIFYSVWSGEPSTFTGRPSRIEGIGRQRVEPSFLPDIVDRLIQVPDAASIATMRMVSERTGRSVGGSTGTNVWGAFLLVAEMLSRGEQGSVVTLICDGGDRYAGTYYSDAWVGDQGFDLAPHTERLETFLEHRRVPAVGALDLDLRDDALDRVEHLGWHLVHPMGIAGVRVDILEQLLLVLIPRHPLAAGHHVATPELLHETLLEIASRRILAAGGRHPVAAVPAAGSVRTRLEWRYVPDPGLPR